MAEEAAAETQPSVADVIAEVTADVPAPATAPAEGTPAPAAPVPTPATPGKTPEQLVAEANDRARAALGGAARRERQALAREQAATQAIEKAKQFDELMSALREGAPAGALSKHGVNVAKMLERMQTEGDGPTPQDEIGELRKRLDMQDAQRKEQERQGLIERERNTVFDAVKQAGERFELINATEQHDLVWQSMVAVWQRDGVAPDPLEIAQHVESHLESQLLERAAKTKKFQARIAPPKPTPASNGNRATQPSPGAVTLSDSDQAVVPPSEDDLPMDPHDRMRALLAQFA